MSWRSEVALRLPKSKVFHLSQSILHDEYTREALCGAYIAFRAGGQGQSLAGAVFDGGRLCKKCEARCNEIFARLLEVNSAITEAQDDNPTR